MRPRMLDLLGTQADLIDPLQLDVLDFHLARYQELTKLFLRLTTIDYQLGDHISFEFSLSIRKHTILTLNLRYTHSANSQITLFPLHCLQQFRSTVSSYPT